MSVRFVVAVLALGLASGSTACSSAPGDGSVGAASEPISASPAGATTTAVVPTCSASWASCGAQRHEVIVTCDGSVDPLTYERFQPSGWYLGAIVPPNNPQPPPPPSEWDDTAPYLNASGVARYKVCDWATGPATSTPACAYLSVELPQPRCQPQCRAGTHPCGDDCVPNGKQCI